MKEIYKGLTLSQALRKATKAPGRCKKRDCKYYCKGAGEISHSCCYADVEGKTKHKVIIDRFNITDAVKDDWRIDALINPAACPFYDSGKRSRRVKRVDLQKDKYDWGRARELYAKGYNDKQIAFEIGCRPNQVCNWRRGCDLPANTNKDIRINYSQAAELYDSGLKASAIAKAMGCSESSIRGYLKKYKAEAGEVDG